ncbi:MAG: thermonuclease family protein [Nitrospirae bacterium]|nr:thermonuclease family protein [Magnetococcales bacterium]HAT50611.1 nuclease [Alphaproteobacteria bacterium]
MRTTIMITLGMLLFLPSLEALSGEGRRTYGDLEGAIYLGNYDGDTLRFDIPGVHLLFGGNIPVRVRGVDTPEIRAKCPVEKRMALEARERVRQLLANAKRITLRETGRDKYFRIVARVEADGVDVGEMLIGAGLAVPYDGDRKTGGWCGANADLPNH